MGAWFLLGSGLEWTGSGPADLAPSDEQRNRRHGKKARQRQGRVLLLGVGDDSRFFALLGSAPQEQELNTVRPEAKLTC
jgi:hypothetical protein